MAIRTFAAVDVGSFEIELAIYELSATYGVRQIDHLCHKIALGRDTYLHGKIAYPLVEELCTVLKDFADTMRGYRVADYRAYATSAMREAKNSQIVLDQILVKTGLVVRIISNSEQRFISYKAIVGRDSEFQKIVESGTAIVDVGFGSMQLSLFDQDSLVSTQNIPVGIMRLRGTLAELHAMPEVNYYLLEELIRNELITFRKLYLKGRNLTNLIATGETLITLISHLEKERSFRGWVEADDFQRLCQKLYKMPLIKVQEYLEVNGEHAALLVAASIIYKQVLEMTGAKMIWIPGICLVDGIAVEYAIDHNLLKLNHNFETDIIAAARNMAKRYKCHMIHIQAVEQMALTIFDAAKKIHGLKSRERLLLQIAANLHACGKFISVRNTGECCYNIIMSTEMIGLSHLEREIVANVVRYHILEFEYNEVHIESHPNPGSRLVSTEGINILIAKLTAILRLANATDRSHRQKLLTSTVRLKEKELVIAAAADVDIVLEELSINQKADFFEEIFGIRPVLKQRKRV